MLIATVEFELKTWKKKKKKTKQLTLKKQKRKTYKIQLCTS